MTLVAKRFPRLNLRAHTMLFVRHRGTFVSQNETNIVVSDNNYELRDACIYYTLK